MTDRALVVGGVDPFTMAYREVATALFEHPYISENVKLGNRITFDSTTDPDPIKSQVQDGDVPELMLIPIGIGSTSHTNTSVNVTRTLEVRIVAGDLRVNLSLFPLEWAVIQALHHFLKREHAPFLRDLSIESVNNTMADDDANRGTRQWVAVCRITLDMWFNNDDMTR